MKCQRPDNKLSAPYNKITVLAKIHKNAKNAMKGGV